ncbi:unnamed protein product [Paramecium sonneborni]|uniref:Uncharacterized protein n=1 Tax=Paramecium sonneborni TaxID=65129 RepID=A0A8S1PT33_9CILI|nr:unnamed protein product [Paramecium sonneborni]
MDIDELLDEIDLNNEYKPSNSKDRNRRSFIDPPKFETQKISNDPYEFDSILKASDSPIEKQQSFVSRQRPQTAIIDESKKQKMADLFQLPKPNVIKDQPLTQSIEESNNNNNDLLQTQSRRGKMRMLSQNKGQPQRSDMNSSQDPIINYNQQFEIEKQSVQSDYSIKQNKQPEIAFNLNNNQLNNTNNNLNNVNLQKLQDELQQLKQEKEKLNQEIQQIKNEKDRLSDELDIEKRERIKLFQDKQDLEKVFIKEKEYMKLDFEREKQRIIDTSKLENEILKQQLGEQKQLDHLAEKINVSAKELELLKNQLYQKNEQQTQDKIKQLDSKQNEIKEKESQLEKERSYLENEKRRLTNLQDDISRREQLFQASVDGEKKSLQSEKQLLQDIKESLRNLELETKKRLEQENLLLQRQKNEFEIHKNELNSQAQSKLRQLDVDRQIFEQQKLEYTEFTQKNNEIIQQRYADIEKQQQKIGAKEMQLIAQQRDLDMKNNQVSSLHAEYTRKLALVENERQLLLGKLKEINDKEQFYQQEITNIQEFKQQYQQEKEQIQKQKIELSSQQSMNQQDKIQIEQEKSQLNMMHKTLSHLRQEITQNTLQGFSQTAAQIPPRQSSKNKIEKPRSASKIPLNNNTNPSINQSSQNFDVASYMKFLKNVDYLH